jgi:hypothetical protein
MTQVINSKPVLPGTPAMETLVSAGYGITLEEANEIIKTRKENPGLVSYDDYKKALNMIAAYKTKPIVIDPQPGFRSNGS